MFILSQHDAAVRRLLAAVGSAATLTGAHWLGEIAAGRAFATVGISHLTTSRRLGATAVETSPGSFRFDGAIPWVTAAQRAQVLVTGAALADGRKMLVALPTNRPGVVVRPPLKLAALQASCTSEVVLEDVEIDDADVLAGPAIDLMSHPGAVGTAGLETSALALGQAHAALDALWSLAPAQSELAEPLELLCENWQTLWSQLIAQARGEPDAVSPAQIRSAANTLVLRSTQAYLTMMKGTGFLQSEPAQRWARQALFSSSGRARPRSPTPRFATSSDCARSNSRVPACKGAGTCDGLCPLCSRLFCLRRFSPQRKVASPLSSWPLLNST